MSEETDAVKLLCDTIEQPDGSWQVVIFTTGLFEDEAKIFAAALEAPSRSAIIAATAKRQKHDSFIRNNHTGEETPLNRSKLQ